MQSNGQVFESAVLMPKSRVRLTQHYRTNPSTVRAAVAGIVRTVSKRDHVARPKEILPRIDGRSVVARRYRDLYLQIISDQGGPERVSEVREQLIRRYAAASVLAEMLEAELANGKRIDLGQHALLTSSLVRLSSRIGIDRRAKNVTPALKDYISAKRNGGIIDHEDA